MWLEQEADNLIEEDAIYIRDENGNFIKVEAEDDTEE